MRKNSNEISSVDCLKYLPNVTVLKEPRILKYGDVSCLLMPWRRNHEHEKETLATLTENIDYMFCHTETRGIQTSPSVKYLHEGGNDVSIFKRFKRVYSGHIHYCQAKENFVLVGNPYPMTRSDRDNQKGIFLLDLETGTHQFFENNFSPLFLRYYINEILEMRMEDIEKEIKDNFVDVFIPSNILGKYNINMFMDYLDGIARRLEPKIYDEENPYDRGDGDLSDFTGELDIMNIAAEHIDSLDYDEDLKERLKVSVEELYKRTLSPNYED